MAPGVADLVIGLKLALTSAVRDALIDQQLLAEFLRSSIGEKVSRTITDTTSFIVSKERFLLRQMLSVLRVQWEYHSIFANLPRISSKELLAETVSVFLRKLPLLQ